MDDIFYNVDDLLNISDEELGAAIEENNACNMSIPLEVGSLFSVDGSYDIDWMKDFLSGEPKQNTLADFQIKMEEQQGPKNLSKNAISSDLISDSEKRSYAGKSSFLFSRMTIPGKPRSKRSGITLSSWVSTPISSIASSGTEKRDIHGALRCTHCGVNKTPQWRCGPLGPKTLCNACGMRYKSGGLLPEYRPAASPTFWPHKHSNSSKMVLEMRRRKQLMGEKI